MRQSDENSNPETVRVVALISGGGRTLRNLLEYSRHVNVAYSIVHVISTRKNAAGNQIPGEYNVPLSIVPRRTFHDEVAFSDAVVEILDRERADLVICAGFLSKLVVPDRFLGRIVNIHPSLLPDFGGKGYYGDRVHQAVLESGATFSGCSIHFVDNEYDAGPIIAQRRVPVEINDTVESLAQRVFQAECDLYPAVLQDLARGAIRLEGDRVLIDEEVHPDSGLA